VILLHNEHFEDLNAVILGVSPDSTKSHKKFIEGKNLEITLLSDEDKKVSEDYGVWQEKMMCGKKYMGVVRTTYIINPKGTISAIWENVKCEKRKHLRVRKLKLCM
jgi:thioredoxin-dependent peroxiredoxin